MNKLLMRTIKGKECRTADPFVVLHNGYYYHAYEVPDGVYVAKTDDLNKLSQAKETLVISKNVGWFAPEIHYLDGAWYMYASPDYSDGKHTMHVMTVLRCKDEAPDGEYENLGMMGGLENQWSIDGTVFEHDGKRYFIWTKCSEMYMAEMSSPTQITGKVITIARPEYDFELKTEVLVNEGPAVLKKGNKIHIIYSANDSKTDDYCLGCLTYEGGDILNPQNWIKSKKPLFQKTETVFGPGHCSFTKITEDGTEKDCMVYHANLISGSGWSGRNIFAKTIEWDENDMPILGTPRI